MDERVTLVLDKVKDSCQRIFHSDLVGIYLHGSIAFSCFNWDKSDIDFIVVVEKTPSLRQKQQFIYDLLKIDEIAPIKGLEMSVVLKDHTQNFIYPTPFELHYSNAHKQACIENVEEYCLSMHGVDSDLAAHFTIIKAVGITLYGEDKDQIFGIVPKADYEKSIISDIANIKEEILENPVYYVLNLCRILAYRKDNSIFSKLDGGFWALQNLPKDYTSVINLAITCYSTDIIFKEDGNRLMEFTAYMLEMIDPDLI